MTTFPLVYFEIAGVCNGKCPWCQTARLKPRGRFADPAGFGAALDRLLLLKLIDRQTVTGAAFWGNASYVPDFVRDR